MEGYPLDEAEKRLGYEPGSLLKLVLFSDKVHPILKPCVCFGKSVSLRVAMPGVDVLYWFGLCTSGKPSIEHFMKKVEVDTDDPQAPDAFAYPFVELTGLFELHFRLHRWDIDEIKELKRIQLYRKKAVCTPYQYLKNAVGMVVLIQKGCEYLADVPKSISLSDIRITKQMLAEYAASEGIDLPEDVVLQAESKPAEPAERREAEPKPVKPASSGRKGNKHRTGRKQFWDAVEKWVCRPGTDGQPSIVSFRDAASRNHERFGLMSLDEIPSPSEDGKKSYYILENGDEISEGTVKNRIKGIYREHLQTINKVTV
jgi:hypothetical protein